MYLHITKYDIRNAVWSLRLPDKECIKDYVGLDFRGATNRKPQLMIGNNVYFYFQPLERQVFVLKLRNPW